MAGNARFHDKLHRKNHHTNPTVGYSDSASDPIASPSEPFQGDFVVNGQLSASKGIDLLSANISGDIYCNNIHVSSVTYTNWISGNSTETIISDGTLTGNGANTLTLDFQKGIYAKSSFFSISNTLCSLGNVNFTNSKFDTLTVTTSSNLNGPLSVFGNTNLNGTLTVIGSSTINGKLSVTNDVNIKGNLLVNGNLSALGDTTQIDTTIVSTSAMIIDTYGTTDALRVTQRGTGNVILVEDEVNPDSSPFVVTNLGNVGIGTLNPTGNFHVSVSSLSAAVKITQAGSTGHALYVEDESGDNTPTVIDYQGHVGVGTTTPNKELTVVGNISATGKIYANDIQTNIGNDITTSTTLVSSNTNQVIGVNSSSPITITVPADSTTNFDIGTTIVIYQKGTGQVTVAGEGGVSLLSNSSKVKLTGQYSSAALFKLASNSWLLGGDITA
jgi:hypothetical protein